MKQLIKDLTMKKEKRKRLRIDIGNTQSLSNDEVEEGDSANPTFSDIDSQANKRLTMQGTSVNRKKMNLFVPRATSSSQPSIKSAMASKEKEHNAKKEVTRGLLSIITRLLLDYDTQDVISGQLEYKNATGDFGMPLAICQ
ncbi:hypothetical protein NC651_038596 [Populus alba x Populus x berolinensis]|nr:hypothetical protein NC651_038596 [Populus alba x Populus x berolinensis]